MTLVIKRFVYCVCERRYEQEVTTLAEPLPRCACGLTMKQFGYVTVNEEYEAYIRDERPDPRD